MKNKYDYLIISLLVITALPFISLLILDILKSSNPCTAFDCKFHSIFLIISFLLIAALLWFTLSNKYKIEKEEMQYKIRIKEMIISTYFSKINKVDWNSDKQDKNIENLNNMLDILYNRFIERTQECD